ncbi:uncharacterized MFS-type transporter C09D4.1-like [Chrysoperla carnea]|uniref:uncharacterized MFS-type transporter C09D4.1-like n=1 Tax=Chrysoperla carnea TaxID=189513 RepID=UPI001D08373C|nr:uncharacterized MFS-type transporter C09D4.1-like [Chrysoperla carnea]
MDSEKYDLEKNDTINSETEKLTDINNTCSVLIVKSQNNIHRKCEQEYVIKVYQKRWFLLALFIIITALNGIQWVQYSIITNITMRYYGITSRMVDYTSLIYLITYLPLVLPASYFMDKYGMRATLVTASLGNCIGCWFKVLSADPDKFYIGFMGQFVLSCTQLVIISTPSSFAAVWFGANEVSTACALGVFGQQLGMALGFILPPLMIRNHEELDSIGKDFYRFFMLNAIITTVVLVLTIIFCQKQPEYPPSKAQALIREGKAASDNSVMETVKSFKRLLKQKSFLTLLAVFGVTLGVFNSFCTFLNQVILVYFAGGQVFAGQVGLVVTIAGMVGSSIIGYILDKTKKYKITAIIVIIMSTIGLILFMISLRTKSYTLVFAASAFLGLFITTFISVAYEYAVELTYPEPEANTAGLMSAFSTFTGVLGIVLFGDIIEYYGEFLYHVMLCAFMMISVILSFLVSNKLKRQAVIILEKKQYQLSAGSEK